jgi:uncharacterized protein (DUF2164 family)
MGPEQSMQIVFDTERRDWALQALTTFWQEQFDESISPFRAEQLLDFLTAQLGPIIYDQALADAKSWLFEKLQDLSIDLRKQYDAPAG